MNNLHVLEEMGNGKASSYTNPNDERAENVRALMLFAHNPDIDVSAERAETAAQLRQLD